MRKRKTPPRAAVIWMFCLGAAVPVLAQGPSVAEAEPPSPPAKRLAPYLVSDPAELFAKGVALVEGQRIAEAKALFLALTLEFPELPEPHINLAVLLAAEGDTAAAAESAEAGMRAHPVCQAAFQLDFLRQLSTESRAKVGDRKAAPVPAPVPVPRSAPPPSPAPPPVVDAAPAVSREAAVAAEVEAWAGAWSEQRIRDYLGFYSPSFVLPETQSRSEWEALRRARISRPRSIAITLSDLEVRLLGEERAEASFRQRYRSDSFTDEVRKVLEMRLEGGRWRIVRERSE